MDSELEIQSLRDHFGWTDEEATEYAAFLRGLTPDLAVACVADLKSQEAAAVIQIKPLTLAYAKRYLREWADLTAIRPITPLHTATHYYFSARDRISEGRAYIQIRVDRTGHVVDGCRYHDIWKRPLVNEYEWWWSEVWQMIDCLSVGDDE